MILLSSPLSILTASYLWPWIPLELVQLCSFLTPSSLDLSHFLHSACPFWDPAWETPLPTFIPGIAEIELSSDSGPFKRFYFVPNVSVPTQLAQECTEKVMLLGVCGTITWKCFLRSDSPTYQRCSLGKSQHPPWTMLVFESAITTQIWRFGWENAILFHYWNHLIQRKVITHCYTFERVHFQFFGFINTSILQFAIDCSPFAPFQEGLVLFFCRLF